MKNRLFGFTLIELLVTMTILAIIGTISALYILWNLSETRDSKRISDFAIIEKSFDIFFTKSSRYPVPDNGTDLTYSGATVWTQGVFGEGVNTNLWVFGKDFPKDPRYEVEYTYSVINTGDEYQLATVLENTEDTEWLWEISSIFIEQTHAANLENAYVRGNYNWFMVQVWYGGNQYFIASPSIITSDISETDILTTIADQKLVFDQFFNLPHSYLGSIDELNGWFSFNVSNPIVFGGDIDDLKSEQGIIDFNTSLKFIYAILPIESLDKYQALTQAEGTTKIKNILKKNFDVDFLYYTNCLDIRDNQPWINGTAFYTIDADGPGGNNPVSVYCDMDTDGGGWTRVWDNHLTYGDFLTGSGILSEWWSNATNTITTLSSPATSGYVLHQTGNDDSEYEVHFDDLSLLQSGYEVRMSLWVTENADGGSTPKNPEDGYMFHNRIYYTDGTTSTDGLPRETLVTANVWWRDWEYQRVRNPVTKIVNNFNWFIGYFAEDTTDLYFTDVRLELFYR